MDTNEKLLYVKLYAETQGDKFHPLSDQILELFAPFEQNGTDDAASYSDNLEQKVREVIDEYEQNMESKYHQYHVDRLRGELND